jgi:arginase family enzyme
MIKTCDSCREAFDTDFGHTCPGRYYLEADPVNKPEHYTQGGIECIDAIQASMTAEEFKGYLKGNALKYLWRYQNKGKPEQDLKKSAWYLDRLSGVIGEP